jgi:speckle-type POZ protein
MASSFLGSRLVLFHDWIVEPVKKTTTVLTKWILFRGEKVFRLCLKDTTKTKNPILLFLAVNLNKLGLRVHKVHYSKQSLESSLIHESYKGESLQLFKANLTEMPVKKCTFSFSIWIEGSAPLYSFHISDRLTKEQFWNASLKSQHHVDVEFVVKDKKFSAHKAVLAARSPVFAAEFTKEKPERKDDDGDGLQQIIRIDDVDPASVEQFLYFLYTGEPMKSSLSNEELLNLAERYQVITLVNLCRAALKNIDVKQMMSCLREINPDAAEMHMEAKFSDSVHIR